MVKSIFVLATVTLLSTTYAPAQELIKVCAEDVRAACGDVAPGGGHRILP